MLTLLSLPLLAMPAVAAAQEAVPPEQVNDVVFPVMGPDGSASELGAKYTLMSGEGDSVHRFDLMGQYMTPGGLGGYATIGGSAGEGESAIGSLEVGALYRRSSGNNSYAVRGGIVLPTASTGDGAFLNLITNAYSRPSDYLTGFPETTSLRLAFAPSMSSGNLVARADLGFDLPIAGDGTELLDGPFMHVDVGAGLRAGQATVLVELSNMIYLEESDDTLHLISLTGELNAGKLTPYASLAKPFTTGDGEIDVINLSLGMRGRI